MPPFFFRRRTIEIEDGYWSRLRADIPVFQHLSEGDEPTLRALVQSFLRDKAIHGAGGFDVDDDMRLRIAALASLPVLRLGLSAYDPFAEVIVYPSSFEIRREEIDELGCVHPVVDTLAGETLQGGPIILAWDEVVAGMAGDPMQVVLHECAHKLDMADGLADGCPDLVSRTQARWRRILDQVMTDLGQEVDAAERAMPAQLDPESDDARPYYASLPLDPYAATDPAECFAVSVEAFFAQPRQLADRFPAWYDCLAGYLRQDPLRTRPQNSPPR